jgi:hypothetical protein
MIATTAKSVSGAPMSEPPPSTSRSKSTHQVAFSPQEAPTTRMPLHSGLSALIQAATSQLGDLADAANRKSSDASDLSTAFSYGDGYTSSVDGDHLASTSARTPVMVPEDGRKQSFPRLLMTHLLDPKNNDVITFLPDGKFFAIRTRKFALDLMIHAFHLSTFDEFLELIDGWGFTRIDIDSDSSMAPGEEQQEQEQDQQTPPSDIQVFRHPRFQKGDLDCSMKMRYGQNPTEARMSAIPDRAKIELTLSCSDDSANSKRRLSPGYVRRESVTSSCSQKPRMFILEDQEILPARLSFSTSTGIAQNGSQDSTESLIGSTSTKTARRRSSADARSLALAMTTDKLHLHGESPDERDSKKQPLSAVPLVDGAVERATHTIVTGAIETLLWDESHTRQTYLKHEQELSKSSLPGVIPISKQLFSQTKQTTTPPSAADAATITATATFLYDSLLNAKL